MQSQHYPQEKPESLFKDRIYKTNNLKEIKSSNNTITLLWENL